jgi:hypothetical protein
MKAETLADEKTAALRRFYGGSRIRTGDLLGAMLALELRRIRIVKRFRPTGIVSPNSFPNISPAVLQ